MAPHRAALLLALALAAPARAGDSPADQARAAATLGALVDEAGQEARLEDPAQVAAGWSSIRCYWLAEKAASKKELDAEKKYARLGAGVVDLRKSYGHQRWMRTADEHAAEAAAQLRQLRVKPADCAAPHMRTIAGCMVAWAAWEADDECGPMFEQRWPEFLQRLDPSIVRR